MHTSNSQPNQFHGVIKETAQIVTGTYELHIVEISPESMIKIRRFTSDEMIEFCENFIMTLELQDGERIRVYASPDWKHLVEV